MKKHQELLPQKIASRSVKGKGREQDTSLEKKKVLRSIEEMPDRFSLDDVIDRLMLMSRIEAAIASSEAGNTVTLEEAKKRHAKWLK